jgi:hypothetical protein
LAAEAEKHPIEQGARLRRLMAWRGKYNLTLALRTLRRASNRRNRREFCYLPGRWP